MKNLFKIAFAVVAFAAVGLGSYKAYGSYTAANMSEENLLTLENVLALSDPESEPLLKWSSPKDCPGLFSSTTYCECVINGSGNVCLVDKATTCTCGKNCK